MTEQAIVTMRLEGSNYEADIELPTNLAMNKLIPELKHFFEAQAPGYFNNINEISLSANGFDLGDKDTLASKGLWTGSIITIRRK